MSGLARTRPTPTALSIAGSLALHRGQRQRYFEYENEKLYFWLGAGLFLLGSILDVLDGALARAGGKATPFGAFIDSTTDRIGEAFVLGAIGLVFARDGNETALAFTFAALAGGTSSSAIRAPGRKRWD